MQHIASSCISVALKKFNSLFRHHEFGKTRTSQRSSRPQFGRERAEVRAEVGAAPSVMPASCPLGRRAIVNSVVSEEDEEEEEEEEID